jgi:hypothetical protein
MASSLGSVDDQTALLEAMEGAERAGAITYDQLLNRWLIWAEKLDEIEPSYRALFVNATERYNTNRAVQQPVEPAGIDPTPLIEAAVRAVPTAVSLMPHFKTLAQHTRWTASWKWLQLDVDANGVEALITIAASGLGAVVLSNLPDENASLRATTTILQAMTPQLANKLRPTKYPKGLRITLLLWIWPTFEPLE